MSDPLGLIAGEGVFPLLVARGARAAGRSVVCTAFRGIASPELEAECDRFRWVGVLRLNQWVRTLRAAGVREAIMVGRVTRSKMYSRWKYVQYLPDLRTLKLWITDLRHDKRDTAVFSVLTRELSREGITLIDSTRYTTEHLAGAGVMTHRVPTPDQWVDARFGWEMAQTLSRLQIGQCLAVIDKNVLAVEAVEGTNAMIDRAGQLCRTGNWTLVKVSNVEKDMRVDVPTVGVTTIERLCAARAACLVLEAGKTILLEKPKVLELADRHRIAIVGIDANGNGWPVNR
jgi:DUF1009 family protein